MDSIDILFSKDAGHNWHTIESNLPITGSYTWHLPDIIDSNKCLIKVVPSIPDANFIYITSGLFTIHPYNPDTAVDAKWRSLGGDFRRTGLSENFGLDLGCIKWQFDTNGPVISSITIGYDDRVHIASEDGTLYTLDTNGVILWNYDTNSPLLSSPTIGLDGTVYVGAENGKLFALDRQGELRWTYSTNGFIYSSPAVSEDGRVYFCSEDGTICALAPDGSKLWSFQTNGPASLPDAILASPAIAADSTVYIAGLYDPNLYALEPNDGSVKWACNFDFTFEPEPGQDFSYTDITPPMLFASPVVADDGTIYQALVYDTNLYAIDPNDGNIIWSTDLGDIDTGWFEPTYYVCEDVNLILEDHNVGSMVLSEPALGPDGTIYVSLDDPHLRAVGPDGTIKWVTRLDSSGGFTLTVGLDGLIYAADDDGSVYVVNENGWEIGRFDGIGPLSFPVIAADNTMFVSDANNKVWAIQAGPCEDRQLVLHLSGREDINGDGNIDFLDFATMADQWLGCTYPFDCSCWGAGGSDCPEGIWDTLADQWQSSYLDSDIDRDGRVDLFDFAAFADRWLGARPSRPPRQPPKEIWTDYWSSYEEIEWLERGSLSRWWYWCE